MCVCARGMLLSLFIEKFIYLICSKETNTTAKLNGIYFQNSDCKNSVIFASIIVENFHPKS
jgi:hypothetical protein